MAQLFLHAALTGSCHTDECKLRACCPICPTCLSTTGFNRGFLDGGGQGGMPQSRRRGVPTTIPSVDNDAALQAIGVYGTSLRLRLTLHACKITCVRLGLVVGTATGYCSAVSMILLQ